MEMKDQALSAADEAAISRQPKPGEEQEQRIVGLLQQELLSTSWSKSLFQDHLKELMIDFFRDSLDHVEDEQYIHDKTQEVLKQFSELSGSRIVEGEEYLESLKGKNVFFLTNHLGTYKLLGLDPEADLGQSELGLDVLHPFPAFYGSLYPVAEALENDLYESAHDYPGVIRKVQVAAGSLILPPGLTGTLPAIEEKTKEMFSGKDGLSLTIFPEGGTSGKRNNGGPYALDKFKTGSLVIAGDLGIPIIPIAQHFDPKEGFKLRVFEPRDLKPSTGDNDSREYFHIQASEMRTEMQGWLDSQQASVSEAA